MSLTNSIAGAFGLGPTLSWATGHSFWVSVTTPLAFTGIGFLIFSWINSLMSNRSGMILYTLNLVFAPFGYGLLGLPYLLGLALAIAPMPLYFGTRWLSDLFE
ncbi:MAG TPA: hypothetical protein PLG97_12730 [Alcaligenes sp.]|nr:hypothetical protein [Alcaligenes sp.]HRL28380.1 hypothetical protein [Alcaligenes sp.]